MGVFAISKRFLTLLFVLVLTIAAAGFAEASVATKQVKVNYSDIKLVVDGKAVSILPSQEPFMLNGVTYVPLRLAGEALDCYVNWQGETKTVHISSKSSAQVISLMTQVKQKDEEITTLKARVAELEKQLEQEKAAGEDLNDLEDELLDDYDMLEDVEIDDITLDGDENEVEVEIEVDLGDYDNEWNDLSDNDIEDWLEDLVADIQDELDGDTKVTGVIIDTDSDDVLVDFQKDGDEDLEVDFEDEDYRGGSDIEDVEDSLEGDRYSVDNLDFAVYYVRYDEDDEEVVVYLEAEDSDASSRWPDISDSDMEKDVEDICDDIVDIFDDDAGVDVETVYIYFYDENDRLLDDFEYDVDSGTLDN